MPFSSDDSSVAELLARNASLDSGNAMDSGNPVDISGLQNRAPSGFGIVPQPPPQPQTDHQQQFAQPGGVKRFLAQVLGGMSDAAMKESTGMSYTERAAMQQRMNLDRAQIAHINSQTALAGQELTEHQRSMQLFQHLTTPAEQGGAGFQSPFAGLGEMTPAEQATADWATNEAALKKDFEPMITAIHQIQTSRETRQGIPLTVPQRASYNAAFQDRWNVLHPGTPLPANYQLGAGATTKDYDRTHTLLESVEKAEGVKAQRDATKAQRDTTNAIRQQTVGLAAQKRSDEDKGIEAVAQAIVQPGNLTALKDVVSMRGDQRSRVFARARELDPTFDPGVTNERIRFLQSYEDPKGRAATNRQGINNILQHASDLSDLNEQYRRADVRVLNTPLNALKNQFGDETYTKFQTTAAVLKDELSLYFAGGYAPTAEQAKTWNNIQSGNATPAQTEAFAKEVVHLGLRRASTFNSQHTKVMGYPDPNMITPDAMDAANKLGMGAEAAQFGSGGQLGNRITRPSTRPSGGSDRGGNSSSSFWSQIPGAVPK